KIILDFNEDTASMSDWTAKLLALPYGRWLVGLAGFAVIGVGCSYFQYSFNLGSKNRHDFQEVENTLAKIFLTIGKFGMAARGVVFSLVGFFLIRAAWRFDPQEARGLDGALRVLAQQPFGQVMLVLVACGLFSYSVHMLVEARYRKMDSLKEVAKDLKNL
ncbi:MAG: DUF1206 domain-containing protein, partial [Spirulinaceae cyanobacterium]